MATDKFKHWCRLSIGLSLNEGDTGLLAVSLSWLHYQAKNEHWKALEGMELMSEEGARVYDFITKNAFASVRTAANHAHFFLLELKRNGVDDLQEISKFHARKWLTAEAKRGLAYKSLEKRRDGVSFVVALANPSVANNKWLSEAMKRLERSNGRPSIQRDPIAITDLQKWWRRIKRRPEANYDEMLTLAFASVALFGNCRGDHIRTALWEKLRIMEGTAGVHIVELTHDKDKGKKASVLRKSTIADIPDALGYSIVAILNWLSKNQPPHIRWIFAHEANGKWQQLSTTAQRKRLQMLVDTTDPSHKRLIGAHSCRVAASTLAGALSLTDAEKRLYGKWVDTSQMQVYYDKGRLSVGAKISARMLAALCKDKKAAAHWTGEVRAMRRKMTGLGNCEDSWFYL